MSERNKNAIFKQKILHFHIYFISLQQLLMLMTRRLHIFVAGLLMSLMMPLSAFAASISYANGILSVTGAEGEVLEVVSLTGKRVMEERISSPAQQIELNIPKGCYIVKVGDVVRKVSVR